MGNVLYELRIGRSLVASFSGTAAGRKAAFESWVRLSNDYPDSHVQIVDVETGKVAMDSRGVY